MGKSAKKTQYPQQKTIQEHNTERKITGRYMRKTNRKTQQRKIAENENRAYNNRIDTGRIRK